MYPASSTLVAVAPLATAVIAARALNVDADTADDNDADDDSVMAAEVEVEPKGGVWPSSSDADGPREFVKVVPSMSSLGPIPIPVPIPIPIARHCTR